MSPTSTYFDGEMAKAATDLNSIDPTTDPAGFYDAQARYDFWENAYDTRQFHVQGARETVAATHDVAADVAQNWKGYGLAAAESLPGGVGTGVEAARHGVDIYHGRQTIGSAALTMGTEAAVGYAGGKVVKLASRGVNKVVGYFAKRLADSRGGGTIGGAQASVGVARGATASTVREKLFGTNDVAAFSNQRVRKINDRMPINSDYAGKIYFDKLPNDLKIKYPHGVTFDGKGQPDFTRYAIQKVKVPFSGSNRQDFKHANELCGFKKTPDGYTWHHSYDGQTLMLIDLKLHDAVRHTGGVSMMKGGLK